MRRVEFTVAALAALSLFGAASPRAASAAQEMMFADTNTLTAEQKVFVSKRGSEVVSHIESALKLTKTSDRSGAQRETGKALAILGSINHVSVATRIHDAIDELLHKTHAKTAKSSDLLPVIGVLDEAKDVKGIGVEEARVSLNRAKDKLDKGATVEAEADIEEASLTLGYLQIDLPIHETKVRLERAMYNLTQNPPNMPNANAALNDALKHAKTFTAMASGKAMEEGVEN